MKQRFYLFLICLFVFELSAFSQNIFPKQKKGLWGFVDKSRRKVIPYQFEGVGEFRFGYCQVKLNGKWGYIDRNGNVVIPIIFDELKSFSNIGCIVRIGDKWGVSDNTGQLIIPAKFEDISNSFLSNYDVLMNGKHGIMDKMGNNKIQPKYDEIRYGGGWGDEHFFAAKLDDKYGIIDTDEAIIVPFEYENIDCLKPDSTVLVKQDGQWGEWKKGKMDFELDELIFHRPEEPALFASNKCIALLPEKRKKCSDKEMLYSIYRNIKYPAEARENGYQGMVVIRFLVTETGAIKNPEIIKSVGGGCDEESLRIINSMPNWSPGKMDGMPVSTWISLPIKFKLE